MSSPTIQQIYRRATQKALFKFYENRSMPTVSAEDAEHVVHVGSSILMARDGVLPGGGFSTAVVANDLTGAINRADNISIQFISFFVYCKQHIYPEVQKVA